MTKSSTAHLIFSVRNDGDLRPIFHYGQRVGWIKSNPMGFQAVVTVNGTTHRPAVRPTQGEAFATLIEYWSDLTKSALRVL